MRFATLAIADAVTLEREKIKWDESGRCGAWLRHGQKRSRCFRVHSADVDDELIAAANGNPKYVFRNSGSGQPETAVKNWHKDRTTERHQALWVQKLPGLAG